MKQTYKVILGLGAVVLLLGGAFWYLQYGPVLPDRMVPTVASDRVTREVLGISFAYRSGEDAYTLIESASAQLDEPTMLQAFLIMNTQEYLELQQSEDAREAPPAINILVFDRPTTTPGIEEVDLKTEMEMWAQQYSGYSAIDVAQTPPEMVEIDGVPALHYVSDGLYRQDVYVVKYSGNMYLFIGQYFEPNDETHTAFQELIESVFFI